jgi:hypothetical protein
MADCVETLKFNGVPLIVYSLTVFVFPGFLRKSSYIRWYNSKCSSNCLMAIEEHQEKNESSNSVNQWMQLWWIL